MTTPQDDRENINLDSVITKVLEELGRPPRFASTSIPLCDGWGIVVRRPWYAQMDQAFGTSFSMELLYYGSYKKTRVISSITCEDLSSALGAAPRLVKDCKKLVWDDKNEHWTYPA